MTDTKTREATAGPPSPPSRPDGLSSPEEPKERRAGASPGPPAKTFRIGPWILWFLGRAARADYQCKVSRLNRYLTEYLKNTEHLSENDRRQISERPPSFYRLPGVFWFIRDLAVFRPDENSHIPSGPGANQGDGGQQQPGKQLPPSLELMNAYQAWEAVFNRFIWAIACLVAFPLWPVCAIAASALVGASPPRDVEIVYLCILALFAGKVLAAYLRIEDREAVFNWRPHNLRLLFGILLGLSGKQPVGASRQLPSSSKQPAPSDEPPVPPDEPPVPPGWLLMLPSWLLGLLNWIVRLLNWMLRPLSWLIDLSVVAVSGWLLYGAWFKLGLPEVTGALLLSMLGTLIVAAAAIFVVLIAESNTGSVRMAAVAVYLAGATALVLAARLGHQGWPSWLVHDTQSAIGASLSVVGVLAFVS